MENDSNPFLNPVWLDFQRRYLESLTAGTAGLKPPAGGEWQRAWQDWWSAVMPMMPEESKPVFNNVRNQSNIFLSLSSQFAGMLQEIAEAGRDDEWQSVLNRHIRGMQDQFRDAAGMEQGSRALPEAWKGLFDAWRQAFMFMPPDELLGGIHGGELKKLSEQFLSLPGIGPFREEYEAMQECMRHWQAYQDKCVEYRAVFYRLGREALDRLEQKILEMGRGDRKIENLRQLYDLWVESNEEVFSEYAATEEYSVLYGELVSAYMAFRRQSMTVLEDIFERLNVPSGRSLQRLSRDQKRLHEDLRNSREEQQQLRSQLRELQEEIERLRNGAGTPAAQSGKGHRKKRGPGPDESN